jgi:hypothetical protein
MVNVAINGVIFEYLTRLIVTVAVWSPITALFVVYNVTRPVKESIVSSDELSALTDDEVGTLVIKKLKSPQKLF